MFLFICLFFNLLQYLENESITEIYKENTFSGSVNARNGPENNIINIYRLLTMCQALCQAFGKQSFM